MAKQALRDHQRVFRVIADHSPTKQEAHLPVALPKPPNPPWGQVLGGKSQGIAHSGSKQDAREACLRL
jgi:hypothetical protein